MWLAIVLVGGHALVVTALSTVSSPVHGRVVFVRHGQSVWNADKKFTGWADVDMTQTGRQEAAAAADQVIAHGLHFDRGFSSELKRAQETLTILLDKAGQLDLEVSKDWRLNERHYGALQGSRKEDAVDRFGRELVKRWRNSYDCAPPPAAEDDRMHPANDQRYADVPREILPNGESLKDTLERCLPFWREHVEPELRDGRNVLISAHGHSIRALVKHLDDISDDEIERVSLPNGIPLLYELDACLKPIPLPLAKRAIDACGQPSPLNAVFLCDEHELSNRLIRDAEVIGLECPLPPDAEPPALSVARLHIEDQQLAAALVCAVVDQPVGKM